MIERDQKPVSVRRGCRARGWTLAPRVVAVSDASAATTTAGVIFIGLGDALSGGVIHFRTADCDYRSVTECVLRLQAQIFGHVFAHWDLPSSPPAPSDGCLQVTLCLPTKVDVDEVVALHLVCSLLEDGELPVEAPVLAQYMSRARHSAGAYRPWRRKGGNVSSGARDLASLGELLEASDHDTFNQRFVVPLCFRLMSRQRSLERARGTAADVGAGDSRLSCSREAQQLQTFVQRILRRIRPDLLNKVESSRDELDELCGDLDAEEFADVRAALSDIEADRSDLETEQVQEIALPLVRDRSLSKACCLRVCRMKAGVKTRAGKTLLRIAIGSGWVDVAGQSSSMTPQLVLLETVENDHTQFRFFLMQEPQPLGGRSGVWLPTLRSGVWQHDDVDLWGLGEALQHKEVQKRRGNQQSGFVEGTWYGGSNHQYRIVGSPYRRCRLKVDEVKEIVGSKFWFPLAVEVTVSSIVRSRPDDQTYWSSQRFARTTEAEPHKWIYKPRHLRTGDESNCHTREVRYQDDERLSTLQTSAYRLTERQNSNCYAHPETDGILGYQTNSEHADFRVVVIHLAKLDFPSALSNAIRELWQGHVCGTGSVAVHLGTHCLVDVGSKGIVLWCSSEWKRGISFDREVAEAAVDLLAYRDDLASLLQCASHLHTSRFFSFASLQDWWKNRSAGSYLIRFIDVVKSFRPEAAGGDLRMIVASVEKAHGIDSTLERLERFLQFSDERERIVRDGLLQALLLLLAIPVLLQTPAELLQAWSAWNQVDGPRPGVTSFWTDQLGSGLWILKQVGFVLASIVALAVLLVLVMKSPAWLRRLSRWQRGGRRSFD